MFANICTCMFANICTCMFANLCTCMFAEMFIFDETILAKIRVNPKCVALLINVTCFVGEK